MCAVSVQIVKPSYPSDSYCSSIREDISVDSQDLIVGSISTSPQPSITPTKPSTPFSPSHSFFDMQIPFSLAEQRPSLKFVIAASNAICILLQPVFHDLFISVIPTDPTLEDFDELFTEHGKVIHDKTKHMFHFVGHYAPITIGEIIHSIFLFYQLILIEEDNKSNLSSTIVTEDNLGTLLMCGMMISVKMDRDVPFRNSWWAKLFRIGLEVVNQSELVFLEKIHFQTLMEERDFQDMFTVLIGGLLLNERRNSL
ncbi:uncharacterized protein MONOS_161 [Monocercomonoides exilis]|uniref:uncharacterized protein n=1 Tax=Monocercomonoides exilis TaxID=2049356 RepID=UPI00355A77DE|nr:hypothetical protein MONOS_161 [Monocercomonoides exilis]|eukprot:MONOS_161.1-p1 / transcript=MONOS_161.1 / gene=MONOS_161 / organism=Monocercomonoides_exilis_PA203 / gene_product=unspecified product / transcript_product=unspecified product / location=Mono_scaffold00003:62117-62997(+) / protein_length=254 / sequence_SO=supercontig / SO=protein_coding / is_pseudo=false